jgi:hypothetical protein
MVYQFKDTEERQLLTLGNSDAPCFRQTSDAPPSSSSEPQTKSAPSTSRPIRVRHVSVDASSIERNSESTTVLPQLPVKVPHSELVDGGRMEDLKPFKVHQSDMEMNLLDPYTEQSTFLEFAPCGIQIVSKPGHSEESIHCCNVIEFNKNLALESMPSLMVIHTYIYL